MLSQDEQVALFVDAINKDALKMCREIEKETKKSYTARTQELEAAARDNMFRRLEYAEKDIMTQLNRKAAADKSKLKQELYKRREELTGEVFDKAKKQLIDFTRSEGYSGFIESSIINIMSVLKSGIILYVKPDDIKLVSDAAEKAGLSCEVKADETILIGGILAHSETEKKTADDTLDERLSGQREWFLSHTSGELNV